MMIRIGALCLSLAIFAAPALVQAQEDQQAVSESAEASERTAAADDSTQKAQLDDQKIKCRKLEVTGSLVKREKVCKTIAGWREFYREGNRNARTLVDATNQGNTNGS